MKNNTLVWCKTKEQVREVLAKAKKKGYSVSNIDELAERFWNINHSKLVINLNGDGIITHCYKEWYEKHSEYGKIITAEKFLGTKPILITRNGRLTIAEDKNTGEKGIASCSPDDTYDFHTGALIAVARLVAKDGVISGDAETVLRGLMSDKHVDDGTNTTKFKVGDLVTLKNGLEPGKEYGNMTLYHGDMFDSLNGKPKKVKEVWKRSTSSPSYRTEDDWYYSEEMLEAWDENAIREGDRVKVVSTGKTFDTYFEWVARNIESKDLIARFKCDSLPKYSATYEVLKIAPHSDGSHGKLAYIQGLMEKRCYVIGINGLEKVTK